MASSAKPAYLSKVFTGGIGFDDQEGRDRHVSDLLEALMFAESIGITFVNALMSVSEDRGTRRLLQMHLYLAGYRTDILRQLVLSISLKSSFALRSSEPILEGVHLDPSVDHSCSVLAGLRDLQKQMATQYCDAYGSVSTVYSRPVSHLEILRSHARGLMRSALSMPVL